MPFVVVSEHFEFLLVCFWFFNKDVLYEDKEVDERGLERYNTLLWRVLVNEQRGSVARMLVRNYADIFASPSYRIALPHLDGNANSKFSLLFRRKKD